MIAGTERSRHFNKLFTKTVDGFLGGNWNVGDHEMKFGAELSQNKIYNAYLQDANGQYKFQCENSTANFTYSTITGPVVCAPVIVNGVTTPASSHAGRSKMSRWSGAVLKM